MLKNYFLIAFRNLKKNKVFSLVNIAGLSVGLTVFWLMALYIVHELSFDRSWENAGRIYRVAQSTESPTGSFHLAVTPVPMAAALKKDYSEIEQTARLDQEGGGTLVYNDKIIRAEDILMADNSLLTIFRYPFLYGDPNAALLRPGSIVLTRSLAGKLFGDPQKALNQSIFFQHDPSPLLITGIMEDIPSNSHLHFSALRSFPADYTDTWQNSHIYTYLLLKPAVRIKQLEDQLPGFYHRWIQPQLSPGMRYSMQFQPLPSIHLHSHLRYEISENGDIMHIWIFSAVALLVLIIAIINYINLSTARSSIRVKEVGLRKVIGSLRSQLICLFLLESLVYTLLAALIATGLTALLLPYFNQLSGKELGLWQFGKGVTILLLTLFSLLTGLAGGIYPALFLSGFRTIPALKGQQGNLRINSLFRKSLVSFQFVITVLLITGSLVLYRQLAFMQDKDLGFNKYQVLTFHIPNHAVRQHIAELKSRLLQSTFIDAASAAGNPIGNNDIGMNAFLFEEEGGQISSAPRTAQTFYTDADFLPTMQISLLKGRNFSPERPADILSSVLVNQTLVDQLGWKDPIGKRVRMGLDSTGKPREASVIGVVKDFNIYSLQHKIEPLVLEMPPVLNEDDNCYVRVAGAHIPEAVKHVQSVYRDFDPSSPFEYHFLDENFDRQYAAERNQGRLLLIFTSLAIFIASLGLFGLVTFSVEQRSKEIGIRKVLGASVPGIIILISKELLHPILLAVLFAAPIAWWSTHKWLESFPYRANMPVWLFAGAGLMALLIAACTLGTRALKAATNNPSKVLRSE